MTPRARELADADIAERVWTVPEIAAAGSILFFASLPTEVSTDAIAAGARRRGIQVVYPRCLPETAGMLLHAVEAPELLVAGYRGIREPLVDCPLITLAEIDVVLVPGLAWDDAGHRLGRGAGYYDRLFAVPERQPFRVGLYFETQRMPALPADPWDVPLDAVVTEGRVWRKSEE
jgi:5-formyltetrahydrofolate cyclo-ligase